MADDDTKTWDNDTKNGKVATPKLTNGCNQCGFSRSQLCKWRQVKADTGRLLLLNRQELMIMECGDTLSANASMEGRLGCLMLEDHQLCDGAMTGMHFERFGEFG